MDVMKPIYSDDAPIGDDWLYEIKYDGYRAILTISEDGRISLKSRNNRELTEKFPEVVEDCANLLSRLENYLPLTLDGELVILNNRYQGNFSEIQKRGKLRNQDKIRRFAKRRPAHFLLFDVLEVNGKNYTGEKLSMRKHVLTDVFRQKSNRKTWSREISGKATEDSVRSLDRFEAQLEEKIWPVDVFATWEEAEKIVFRYKGEGVVAKRKSSTYHPGKKHRDWFKVKNWRRINGLLTAFDAENDYFDVAVFDGEHGEALNSEKLRSLGKCKHGLTGESFVTLKRFFMENGKKQGNRYSVPPAISAAIHTLDLYEGELREPQFAAILPGIKPESCTVQQLKLDLAMLPDVVDLTNMEKLLWKDPPFSKGDLLVYVRDIAPYMLPFLESRLLTVIRAPDGVDQEQFFQKHLPAYAPEFVTAVKGEDEVFCSCDNLESLVWFANHGAVEYHIPFQRAGSVMPLEIVFDLDPPDREHFHLAVKAAQLVKVLLDELSLVSFVKTSGNKGLQIHIPILEGSMTYEETAVFTQAIAFTIENSCPDLFTTERMKDKRGGKLYIDYVQHGRDKTIIAPYSPRKTSEGTVATPLFWDEVTEDLNPVQFTIGNVLERVKANSCPFAGFGTARHKQNMNKILNLVRSGTKRVSP